MNKLKKSSSNPNLIRMIKILNDGLFHTGASLGSKLGITRSAIWKWVQQLKSQGVSIETVKSKGYRLLEPLILLDKKEITQHLEENFQKLIQLEIFSSIDSTNEYLKNLPVNHHNKINITLAEQQTKGRGRLKRNWYSPFAENIYFSSKFKFNKDLSELSGLSLIVGLAVTKTLQEFDLQDDIKIKWPNDILWQNKKVAGILLEILGESHSVAQVIIGIGINVNMRNENNNVINQPWASMRDLLHVYINRNLVIAKLINNLCHYLQRFNDYGFKSFLSEWHRYDYLYQKSSILMVGDQEYAGTVVGINDRGYLLLETNGMRREFSSGAASIKKLS